MDVRYNLEFSFLFSFNFLLPGGGVVGGGGDDGNVAIISFIVGKVKMY